LLLLVAVARTHDVGAQEFELDAPTEEQTKLNELEDENKTAFLGTPYRYMAIFLGLGSESIDTSGGSSEFTGQAGIGGTTVEFAIDLSNQIAAPVSLYLIAQGHNFTTNQSKVKASQNTEEKLTTSHQFVEFDAYTGYILFPVKPVSLELNLGVSAASFPAMEIQNQENGQSELTVSSVLGIVGGLTLEWDMLSMGLLRTSILYSPMAMSGKMDGRSLQIQTTWRYPILQNLFTHFGIGALRALSHYDLICPAATPECSALGTGKLTRTVFQMGAGVKF
jgi:hypothetical protein